MRSIIKRAILKASVTDFELACIAGVVVIVSDLSWLIHDIVTNGFSVAYGFIGFGMIIGLVSTVFVIARHNAIEAKRFSDLELKEKLKNCKRKAKHKAAK